MTTLTKRPRPQRLRTAPQPMSPFDELWRRVDAIFEDVLRHDPLLTDVDSSLGVELQQTDDAWILETRLPGARPRDLDVRVCAGELRITGEIQPRRWAFWRPRTTRLVDYRVALPNGVDEQAITASLHRGALSVRLPKLERLRRRRIPIGR